MMTTSPAITLAKFILHMEHHAALLAAVSDKNVYPIGRLTLSEEESSIWTEMKRVAADKQGSADVKVNLLAEIVDFLSSTCENMGNPPMPVGTLDMSQFEYSLWGRAQSILRTNSAVLRCYLGQQRRMAVPAGMDVEYREPYQRLSKSGVARLLKLASTAGCRLNALIHIRLCNAIPYDTRNPEKDAVYDAKERELSSLFVPLHPLGDDPNLVDSLYKILVAK